MTDISAWAKAHLSQLTDLQTWDHAGFLRTVSDTLLNNDEYARILSKRHGLMLALIAAEKARRRAGGYVEQTFVSRKIPGTVEGTFSPRVSPYGRMF